MKTPAHPPVSQITVQGILHALSDPLRMAIFVGIQNAETPCNCSAFLEIDHKSIPKSTLSQHFRVLREAGLITSERKGIEIFNRSRLAEIEPQWGAMIMGILQAYIAQLAPQPATK